MTLQYALSEASRRLSASGSRVRYLGSTFVPERGRCFCLFEAASPQVVKAVNEAALVPYIAINKAIELPAPRRVVNGRRQRATPQSVKP